MTMKEQREHLAEQLPPQPIKTRERILEAARILFNQYGTDAISTRQIAQTLGISHGNLCYHFARKDDIIAALYEQLVQAMDTQVLRYQTTDSKRLPTLKDVFWGSVVAFEQMHQYKFLMLDFVSVMRKLPSVKTHYQALIAFRKQQFTALQMYGVAQGWFRPELFQQYGSQINDALMIMGDFWISSAEILYQGEQSEKIRYYASVFQAMLIPLLTPEGLAQLQSIGTLEEYIQEDKSSQIL